MKTTKFAGKRGEIVWSTFNEYDEPVAWGDVRVSSQGVKVGRKALGPGITKIEHAALSPDGQTVLCGASAQLFEVPVCGAAHALRYDEGTGSMSCAYVSAHVVAVNVGDQLQIFERRGQVLMPGSSLFVPDTDRVSAIAGGKILLAHGANKETVVLACDGARIQEIGKLPFSVVRVGQAGDRVVLESNSLLELDLASIPAKKLPAWTPPKIPGATKLARPPGSPTFAVTAVTRKPDDTEVAWGKVTIRVPFDPAPIVQIVPSPSGRRLLVWGAGYSEVRAFDVASGAELGQWSDDAASGMIRDVAWIDEDHFLFAHWQVNVCQLGTDEPIDSLEFRGTSFAAAPGGAKGTFRIAGVLEPDADGPQMLYTVKLKIGKKLDWSDAKFAPIEERLATVRRAGDAIILAVGPASFQLK